MTRKSSKRDTILSIVFGLMLIVFAAIPALAIGMNLLRAFAAWGWL